MKTRGILARLTPSSTAGKVILAIGISALFWVAATAVLLKLADLNALPPGEWRASGFQHKNQSEEASYQASADGLSIKCESENPRIRMKKNREPYMEIDAWRTAEIQGLAEGWHPFQIRVDEGPWEEHIFMHRAYSTRSMFPVQAPLFQKMTYGEKIEIKIPFAKGEHTATFSLNGFNQAITDLSNACWMPKEWDAKIETWEYSRCGTTCLWDFPMWMRSAEERRNEAWRNEKNKWSRERRSTLGRWLYIPANDPMTDEPQDQLSRKGKDGEEIRIMCLGGKFVSEEKINRMRIGIIFTLNAPWDFEGHENGKVQIRVEQILGQTPAVSLDASVWKEKKGERYQVISTGQLGTPVEQILQNINQDLSTILKVRALPEGHLPYYKEFSLLYLGDKLKNLLKRCTDTP